MQSDELTREEIIEVAKEGCRSLSEVARNLGLIRDTMDGRTGRRLRALAGPELEEIIAGNRKSIRPATKEQKVTEDNPYRPGSTYALIYREGSKGFLPKGELVRRLATMTGKPARSIEFSLIVLSSKGHSSNMGRSTALREGDRIRLIPLNPKSRPIH